MIVGSGVVVVIGGGEIRGCVIDSGIRDNGWGFFDLCCRFYSQGGNCCGCFGC